jgi:hypothetical protein
MRFSIRDLLWLMAVVALATSLFVHQRLMWHMQTSWATERSKLRVDAEAAALAADKQLDALRNENALLRHQVVTQMEKQRELERRVEVTAQADNLIPARTPFRPTSTPVPESTEAER